MCVRVYVRIAPQSESVRVYFDKITWGLDAEAPDYVAGDNEFYIVELSTGVCVRLFGRGYVYVEGVCMCMCRGCVYVYV